MSIGEVLKKGFHLTNRFWPLVFVHLGGFFLLFVILFFSILIPLIISGTHTLLREFEWDRIQEINFEDFPLENVPFLILTFLPFVFLGTTLSSGLTIFLSGGVKGIYKEELLQEGMNPSFSFSRFFQNGKFFFWRIAGLWVLLGLILISILLLFGVPMGGVMVLLEVDEVGEGLFALVLLMFLLFFSLLLFTLYAYFANVLLVMENERPGGAVKGGIRFLKDHFGPAARIFFVLFLIQFGVGLFFIFIQLPFSFIPLLGTLTSLFLLPFQSLLSIYLSLFLTATLMVFYWDRSKDAGNPTEAGLPFNPSM